MLLLVTIMLKITDDGLLWCSVISTALSSSSTLYDDGLNVRVEAKEITSKQVNLANFYV